MTFNPDNPREHVGIPKPVRIKAYNDTPAPRMAASVSTVHEKPPIEPIRKPERHSDSPMPTVSAWANELRAEFGTDAINAAIRQHGYMAAENGRVIDTRKPCKEFPAIPGLRYTMGKNKPA